MIPVSPFSFAHTPSIIFGRGTVARLGERIASLGDSVLLVTGASSFTASGGLDAVRHDLTSHGIRAFHVSVAGEPTPEIVDDAAARFRGEGIAVVCAIGGGSPVDAGKAISAMLPGDGPVLDYLEGVGAGKRHDGIKVPFIAVPTTSGTGSEATKNAVLSRVGPDGFKSSLRHDALVPDIALIDPELIVTCPPGVTAASGLDAVTQLLESYVSTKASPFTDTLAESGLRAAGATLIAACTTGAGDPDVRAGMAYASLLSGITLANAGLGVVHGFASSIGGHYDIPHGVICGTLMATAARMTVELLRDQSGDASERGRAKYARAGVLLAGEDRKSVEANADLLVETLAEWTGRLDIPRLGEFGVSDGDIDRIVAATGAKNNPGELDEGSVRRILAERL